MKLSKPRLLFDADGVLIDFTTPALRFLASAGRPKTYEQVVQWDMFEGDIELEDEFKETYASEPGYCYNLPPTPGSVDFVRAAHAAYDVQIVTTPYDVPPWYNERKDALVDRFGLSRSAITFTHHKQYVEGDVLVEDKVENAVRWHDHWNKRRVKHLAVIMDQPWNRVELPKGIVRARSFVELSDLLREFGLPAVY